MRPRTLLLWLPALVLASAFAAICIHFHSLWPFNLQVHEDGRHTLLGTIFYFEHAAGELPVDLLLSAAIAGAMLRYAGPAAGSPAWRLRLTIVCIAIIALIFCGSVSSVGGRATLDWFLQFHTRDGSPLEFGSHWRYHLLSETSLMLLGACFASVVSGRGAPSGSGRLLQAAWIAFAILSVVFGLSAAPFTDARYLGHQARETITHALTTVPLGVAACCAVREPSVGQRIAFRRLSAIFSKPRAIFSEPRALASGLALFIALALYQCAGAVLGGVREHSQTNDPVRLVCTHFFEHTFSYLVVSSHAALLYVLASRATEGTHS